jgi:hypothetical protein
MSVNKGQGTKGNLNHRLIYAMDKRLTRGILRPLVCYMKYPHERHGLGAVCMAHGKLRVSDWADLPSKWLGFGDRNCRFHLKTPARHMDMDMDAQSSYTFFAIDAPHDEKCTINHIC